MVENPNIQETKITIECSKADSQILKIISLINKTYIILNKYIHKKKFQKMSLSPKNENDSNEVASNLANSEEPKISLEQRSLMDPSTERGSKHIIK